MRVAQVGFVQRLLVVSCCRRGEKKNDVDGRVGSVNCFVFFCLCRFRECAVVCTPSQGRCFKERQKQRQRQTDREREVPDASSAWRSVRLGSAHMLRSVGRTFLSPRETVTEPLSQILLCRLAGHSFLSRDNSNRRLIPLSCLPSASGFATGGCCRCGRDDGVGCQIFFLCVRSLNHQLYKTCAYLALEFVRDGRSICFSDQRILELWCFWCVAI